jgi:hypothetical protein
MALPPSRLTDLVHRAGSTPEALVAALSAHGCLTSETVRDPSQLMALLSSTITEAEARPPMPGPSTSDLLVWALLESAFLSATGREWSRMAPEEA